MTKTEPVSLGVSGEGHHPGGVRYKLSCMDTSDRAMCLILGIPRFREKLENPFIFKVTTDKGFSRPLSIYTKL